jgi:hypothetical protein
LIEVKGVRNSWLTVETNSALAFSICLRWLMSRAIAEKPVRQRWPGLSEQGSAKDKWILCRLFSRDADLGRHAGRA